MEPSKDAIIGYQPADATVEDREVLARVGGYIALTRELLRLFPDKELVKKARAYQSDPRPARRARLAVVEQDPILARELILVIDQCFRDVYPQGHKVLQVHFHLGASSLEPLSRAGEAKELHKKEMEVKESLRRGLQILRTSSHIQQLKELLDRAD